MDVIEPAHLSVTVVYGHDVGAGRTRVVGPQLISTVSFGLHRC